MKINLMNNQKKKALTKHKSLYFYLSMNKPSGSMIAKRSDIKQN